MSKNTIDRGKRGNGRRAFLWLVVGLCLIPIALVAARIIHAFKVNNAISTIVHSGGKVWCDSQCNNSGEIQVGPALPRQVPTSNSWLGQLTEIYRHTVGNDEIVRVDLNGTTVGDDIFEAIHAFPGLIQINLASTPTDDRAISILSSFKCLKGLDLTNTRITNEGYQRLRSALPGTKIEYDEILNAIEDSASKMEWNRVELPLRSPQ